MPIPTNYEEEEKMANKKDDEKVEKEKKKKYPTQPYLVRVTGIGMSPISAAKPDKLTSCILCSQVLFDMVVYRIQA